MTPERSTIWVIARNDGTEGYSGPVQAFLKWSDALAALHLMEAGGADDMEIFEVPLWPYTTGQQWFQVRPVPEQNDSGPGDKA